MRGATCSLCLSSSPSMIFQPTRPLRGATAMCGLVQGQLAFQPTRPLRGATGRSRRVAGEEKNFNPRAPCGARPAQRGHMRRAEAISTHAPLAGRDTSIIYHPHPKCHISTHAPLAGRDDSTVAACNYAGISTHAPLAGRDPDRRVVRCVDGNFNPRAPCGARRN